MAADRLDRVAPVTFVIVLRLVHIVLGVFWVGAAFFIALYLIPSVGEAGPGGAAVMQALIRRHVLEVVPAAAVLNMLSGLVLLWRDSGGAPAWVATPMGLSLSVGAVLAITAFLIGVFGMRAATLEAGRLGASLAGLPEGPEKGSTLAEIQRLRRTSTLSARWVAILLAITISLMAVARYT